MKKIYSMSMRHNKGFLLSEVLLGMVIVSIVILLFGRNILMIFAGWQRMQTDGELLDAGRYVLSKMERHLSLESKLVTVTDFKDVKCETEYPNKTTEIKWKEGNLGLYYSTDTASGTGTNPLFIRDCNLNNWRAERISSKEILVSFTLTKNNRNKDFVRLFYCVNGTVQNGS